MSAVATTRALARHAFPTMGSTVDLTLVGDRATAAAWRLAEALAAEWEATFSRFRPDSELSRLNAAAGRPVPVSARLYDAVAAAVAGSRSSGGLFDPTILPALVALGYDRDFQEIDVTKQIALAGIAIPGVGGIALDPLARTVTLPAGVALDLGGIVKGLYADALAEMLADWPAGVVSAGGDLRAWGDGPSGDGWLVGVEDPRDARRDVARLRVRGGVATSGTNRRSWRHGDVEVHHLIDPRSGLPGERTLCSVTVVAPTAASAEVAATALFLAGGAAGALAGFGDGVGPALVVRRDGGVHTIEGSES